MNKKKIFDSVVASALCVAMVLSIILGAIFLMPGTETQAATTEGNNFDFSFKKSDGSKVKISFIGDSITTYQGVSNSTNYNSTIGGNAVYYGKTTHDHYAEFADVKLNDTWWMQTINTLGMELCVNNSWSGSRIINVTSGSTAANQVIDTTISKQASSGYYTRCNNLHNDKTGAKPDIVVVFLGTNDIGSRQTTTGLYGNKTLSTVDNNYTTSTKIPGTVVGAYAYMIRRIAANYPDAEIYCCTVLPQLDERLSDNKAGYDVFYKGVKEVVDGYNTGKWTDQGGNTGTCYKHEPGVYLVDFYNESGIHTDKQSRENCYANRLHPNKKGMDAMSNLLISELMEHSQYMSGNTVDVSYDLANTYVEVGNVTSTGETMYGDVTRAVMGKPFQVQINTKGTPNIQYRVTMNGEDVTNDVVFGNQIYIKSVTGDITIRAHEFDYFYWGPGLGGLESDPEGSMLSNANALTRYYDDGTYSVVDGAANFDDAGQAYKMAEPVNLLHDRNWELEFRMSGAFSNGALLMSYAPVSTVWDLEVDRYVKENNIYIFRTGTNGMLAFGMTTERDNDHTSSVSGETYKDYYYHYGVGLTNPTYGGTSGFDVSAMHTYRMFNVYDRATDTNTIYLSVDGGSPVAMTHAAIAHKFDHVNRNTTYQMSGRDMTFNAIGTWDADDAYGHPLRNCAIEYIKVYENGNPVTYDHDPSNYYWEFNSSFECNPEANPIFADNQGTLASGKYVANGVFGDADDASIKLENPVVLKSNLPWILEYQAGGTNAGGILLTSDTPASKTFGNTYIHINQTQVLFGYASKSNSNAYTNSGFYYTDIATKLGSSAGQGIRSETHIYRMQNVVYPDGTNTVQLYVDDILIGDMFSRTSNWVGIDLVINYFGTTTHPLQNIDLDYILIYENGIPKEEADDEINNFRWEAGKNGMTTVEVVEDDDNPDYFTENPATIKMGSGVNGVHDLPSYYQLEKSVNLLHDRDWNIEWRASGSWGGTDTSGDDPMVFSSMGTRKKGFTYIWRNASDLIAFGYWQNPGYHNYGIKVSDTEFGELNDGQMYTYRLENRVERDSSGNWVSNMVYLYIDGVEIGAMNNHFVNSADQNETVDWLNGRDFTFDYIANDTFSLLDVNFEYLQVWEDGYKLDTRKLEYLLTNWDIGADGVEFDTRDPKSNYSAFVKAYHAAVAVMSQVDATQADIDKAYEDFMRANNNLVITTLETKTIYSVELVTGEYARVGKQVGFKVITSPDIAQVCVGSQKLLTNTSQLQKMMIDGEEKTVKVWLVSFKYGSDEKNDGKSVSFGIGAWTTYDANHKGTSSSNPDAHTTLRIPFRSYFVTSLTVDGEPEKYIYGYKEEFDPTGITVTAHYSNGMSVELTAEDYNVLNPVLMPGDTAVTIEFEGATVEIPVTTVANVSQAHWWAYDENDPEMTEPTFLWVQGVYVGFVCDDEFGIYEIMLKDLNSDKILAIPCMDADDLMTKISNVWVNDAVWVYGSVYVDDSTNKTYMDNVEFLDYPWVDVDMGDFKLEGTYSASVHNQGQLSNLFQDGVITPYRYVAFKGTMYLHRMYYNDKYFYTVHMNPKAESFWDMVGENSGCAVQLRDESNLYYNGESVLENLFMDVPPEYNDYLFENGEDMYPGLKVEGTIYGVYGYFNDSYQLMILDSSWVDVTPIIEYPEVVE